MRLTLVIVMSIVLNVVFPGKLNEYLNGTIQFITYISLMAYASYHDMKERNYHHTMTELAEKIEKLNIMLRSNEPKS